LSIYKPVCCLCFNGGGIPINETNFPDARFRTYVKDNFDKDKNNTLSQSECDDVKEIDVSIPADDHSGAEIEDLTGIEHFKKLTSLNCSRNYLEKLDVSKNTALATLNCKENQLASLDVSKNMALKTLDCSDNKLTSLDVSANTALTTLNCESNQLKELDVRNNTVLTTLNCGSKNWNENHLTSLDVRKNTKLRKLDCSYNHLTSLDVSKNKDLTELNCSYTQLTSLDVSQNTALTDFDCSANELKELDVSNNTVLTDFDCSANQLTKLDVSKNTALTTLDCSFNDLTSLDVSQNTKLCKLRCEYTQLTKLDVSKNTKLCKLNCVANQLTSLDVSNNTVLTDFNCFANQLKELDVSQNTALTTLNCVDNQLTSLDVSQNTALLDLIGAYNPLISLKLAKQTNEYHQFWVDSSYTVTIDPGISKIPFSALPQGFDRTKIQGDVTGANLEDDGFNWDKQTDSIKFKYKLCDGPNGVSNANLKVLVKVIGPKDPTKEDGKNPDTSKYWTVKFESADATKGTVDAKNTVYVLKSANKTLADLKDSAPATIAQEGYKFDKWDPALDENTAIDKDMTVHAKFVALDGVIGPKDPTKPDGKNPDTGKYWTVTFESEDSAKGTVAAKNTFYVLKTAKKTLADLKDSAPAPTPQEGYKFDKWSPALDATVIANDVTIKACFKKADTPAPAPASATPTSAPDSNNPQGASAKAVPQTGDSANMSLYAALMGLPGVSLLAAGLRKRRKQH